MATQQAQRIDSFISPAEDMSSAINAFLSYCRSKNLSDNTIVYYGYRLDSFTKYLQRTVPDIIPTEMTSPIIRGFIAYESRHNSPSTANHSIIALRAFFNYLVKDEFIGRSPMSNVEKVRQKKAIIQTFILEQIQQILNTCSRDFVGIRDKAIIVTQRFV